MDHSLNDRIRCGCRLTDRHRSGEKIRDANFVQITYLTQSAQARESPSSLDEIDRIRCLIDPTGQILLSESILFPVPGKVTPKSIQRIITGRNLRAFTRRLLDHVSPNNTRCITQTYKSLPVRRDQTHDRRTESVPTRDFLQVLENTMLNKTPQKPR